MFTINSADLYRVTKESELFASKDEYLPMLAAVKYEVTEHGLIVTSTDRFVAGFNRVDICQVEGTNDDTGIFFLAPAERKHLLSFLSNGKTARRSFLLLVTVGEGFIEVSDYEKAVKVATADVEYPKVTHIIPDNDALVGDVSSVMSIDARKLALFAKVEGSHNAVFMRNVNKETAPLVVRICDNFIGLVMTTRLGDRETKVPAWLSR